MPKLDGISHVSLTVADMDRAAWFWTEVMGCEQVMRESDFCLCLHRGAGLAVSFKDHDGSVSGTFDETRVGLDHLALAVTDRSELERWADHLRAHDVPFSDIAETDLGHHLNLRAPDGVAVELFAIRPEAAAALGLAAAPPLS
ncbi:VOC family protein [Nocardioides sp. MAHUQ-72]|uniref:VOC family protein n=1 Tax=unclassified Nocardioides TaxID=2615069 RepID=UPI00361C8817